MARTAARPERIRADAAAIILGVTTRCVQALAARGEVPGACKVGKLWTFDETALRSWIRERSTCPEQKRQGSRSGAAKSYGRDLPLQARNSAKAFALELQQARRGG